MVIIGGPSILGLGIGILFNTPTIAKLERKLQLSRNQQPPPPTKKWQSSLVGAIIAIIIGTVLGVGSPKNSDLGHALILIGVLILGLGIGVLLSTRTINKLEHKLQPAKKSANTTNEKSTIVTIRYSRERHFPKSRA